MKTPTSTAPWTQSADDLFLALGTSSGGLSRSEAKKRLAENGPNDISQEANIPAWEILLHQFASPLTLILIGASLISFALGDRTETLIILFVILVSGVLAFVQEFRSERALRLLRKKLTRHANVIRDGKSVRIDARELVVGDVVELELGNVVAADLRLFQIEDLEIDESTLTGESVPVPKTTGTIKGDKLSPQRQTNVAFLGTHVVEGSGLGIVVRTGTETEMGRTAALLAKKADETEFQKGIRQFGNFLLKITLGLAFIVAVILGFIHGNWSESLLFALALAVGISPELLPVIITINLSRGALAMSHKHVLVKRLIAIEDLGNADVFCTDKTGTLTVGTPRVRGGITPDGTTSDLPLSLAAYCIDVDRKGRATNPIDEAIQSATQKGEAPVAFHNPTLYDTVSFDYQRRRMSCVIGEKGKDRWIIVKGATKEMLSQCDSQLVGGTLQPLTAADEKRISALADSYHDRGVRLVAIARKTIEVREEYSPHDEQHLELVGFILVSDAPKETAKDALAALRDLHVRIVVLTGDNERVTRYVASQIGFEITGVITGEQVEDMNDHELQDAVEIANVFARITPEHKLRIIEALKRGGHTVGYMGDGVNDAPALRSADVGVSFEGAVDVAKEAAGVILLQKKLQVLADGIREGRRTFVNTRTYINTTISSNFGNMLSVAGAALILPFIPLLPAQILLLNLLGDIPMLAISSDRVPDEEMTYPKRWNIRQISNFMFFFGAISSLADYATFAILLFVAHTDIAMFRSGWFVESLASEVLIILLLRSTKSPFSHRPSWTLAVSCISIIIFSITFVQLNLGASFELVPVNTEILLAVAAIIAGYALLTQLGKMAYARFTERTKVAA